MKTTVYGFLWQYISKLKLLFFITGFMILAGEFLFRAAFYYSSKIVDVLSSDLPRDIIFSDAMVLAVIASLISFVKMLSFNGAVFLEAKFIPLYYSIIAKDLFAHAHKHSTAFFAEEMAGNVATKIGNIIGESVRMYYILCWGVMLPLFAILSSFFFMFNINYIMALILVVLNIGFVILLYYIARIIAPYAEKRAKFDSESKGVLVDSISNSTVVKSFSNYLYEKVNYFKYLKKAAIAERKEIYAYAYLFIVIGVLRVIIEVIFYVIPIYFWYKELITVGDFVLAQTLIVTISGMYTRIMQTFLDVFKSVGVLQDALKMISRPFEIVDAPNAKNLKEVGDIVFDDVFYHYKDSEPLFKGFNLVIQQNKKIGIVGKSGSGKSTLVKILSRYYDIQGGEIRIGKYDIKKLKTASLRQNISIIPQDTSLFNRTIIENIRYGNLKATDEEVIEASKKAYCHDFISALPKGYESKVGERGVMLSGGERQRIAIARAILKNSPILILDEATSALDSESEKYIQESLKTLMEGKTVIAIAHRLSTLREMDEVVVMEKGEIIEKGSHKSLLRKKGVYHKFYEMQSSGFINLE